MLQITEFNEFTNKKTWSTIEEFIEKKFANIKEKKKNVCNRSLIYKITPEEINPKQ